MTRAGCEQISRFDDELTLGPLERGGLSVYGYRGHVKPNEVQAEGIERLGGDCLDVHEGAYGV